MEQKRDFTLFKNNNVLLLITFINLINYLRNMKNVFMAGVL